jgi:pyruvate formate lyase activating enzyme
VVEQLGPDTPVHFTAFHPDFRMLDKPITPPATVAMARRIAMAEGVRYAYVGNVHDLGRQSTVCHACGERLIERDWHTLGRWRLDAHGACASCGTPVAGVFEARPGAWGARRLPVRLADFEAKRLSARVGAGAAAPPRSLEGA